MMDPQGGIVETVSFNQIRTSKILSSGLQYFELEDNSLLEIKSFSWVHAPTVLNHSLLGPHGFHILDYFFFLEQCRRAVCHFMKRGKKNFTKTGWLEKGSQH